MSQYADNEYLFTSESVTEGHPDKVADQISDGVLDAVLRDDPTGRVACETLVNTGLVVVSGEISTTTYVDIQDIVRSTIRQIGYTDADLGFSADSCAVINAIDKQSPDIAQGVDQAYETRTDPSDDDALDVAGAGDQGMMFGYATNETRELMPLPIALAHKLAKRLADVRKADVVPYLRPDGKTQVSVRYRDGRPVEIEKLLISTQHKEGAEALIPDDLWEHVVEPILPKELYDAGKLRKSFLVNPTGRFVIGGPVGDAGLTGRKIIVDTYGGMARHGGGAFSGKDPSKVDRSAAYAARYVAKNLVAAGLADRVEVQVAYAIGVAHPVSVMVETFGTEKLGRGRIQELVAEHFDLRPGVVPRAAQPPPADLPEDGGLRPLRARRPRLHVGAHGQGRGPARGGRAVRRRGAQRLGGRYEAGRAPVGLHGLPHGAAGQVVVDQAARLHERVERRRSHEAQAAALELPGQGHGLGRPGGHVPEARGRRARRGAVGQHDRVERLAGRAQRHDGPGVGERGLAPSAGCGRCPRRPAGGPRRRPRSAPRRRGRSRRTRPGTPRACAGSSATRGPTGTPRG